MRIGHGQSLMVSLLRRDLFGPARFYLLNKPCPPPPAACPNPWSFKREAIIQGASRLKDRPAGCESGPASGGIQPVPDGLLRTAYEAQARAAYDAGRRDAAAHRGPAPEKPRWESENPAGNLLPCRPRTQMRAYDPAETRGVPRLIDVFA